MTSSSNERMHRARPLLGTLVEVLASGLEPSRAGVAIQRAFMAVERVHRLMSFHESSSDVSRLNRSGCRRPVAVDPWTFAVLTEAQELSRISAGAFDVTVASDLVRWGLLPGSRTAFSREDWHGGSWVDIELLPRCRVRFARPVTIDLGGIAKGFAVDRAVDALQRCGVPSGVVNAGGDLRVFGDGAQKVSVRHPGAPSTLLPVLELREEAVATSAPYFSVRRWRGRTVSHLVDPRTRRSFTTAVSVSVRASLCSIADALTKVVFTAEDAAPVLEASGARALILSEREPGRAFVAAGNKVINLVR
jgi:FAD:protein FMN transferase